MSSSYYRSLFLCLVALPTSSCFITKNYVAAFSSIALQRPAVTTRPPPRTSTMTLFFQKRSSRMHPHPWRHRQHQMQQIQQMQLHLYPRLTWTLPTTSNTELKSFRPGGGNDTGSNQKATTTSAIARPDPSILLSAKSDSEQKVGVAAIGAGLLLGTLVLSSLLDWLNTVSNGFLGTILEFTLPLPLGLLFTFLGATHFFYKEEYAAVVPPNGTWGGLWNVPTPGADKLGIQSSAEYHVLWSGVAEIGGGLLLMLGGLHAIPVQIPALLLFLLTCAVTPANIYMFTHDAPLAFAPPLAYPQDHIARGILQIILLSLFWYLTSH